MAQKEQNAPTMRNSYRHDASAPLLSWPIPYPSLLISSRAHNKASFAMGWNASNLPMRPPPATPTPFQAYHAEIREGCSSRV